MGFIQRNSSYSYCCSWIDCYCHCKLCNYLIRGYQNWI